MEKANALKLLKQDHAKVKELLEELSESTERATKKRQDLLSKIGEELRVHAKIEEEIFYPRLREKAKNNSQEKPVAEAYEEHRVVEEMVLPDLEKTDPSTVEFGGRAKVLKELVTHHADEEEDELFKLAKQLLDKQELEELGAQMAERKSQLLARAAE